MKARKYVLNQFICLMGLILIFTGCESKESIVIPKYVPVEHPLLLKMQSLSVSENNGFRLFGKSKRYQKRGVQIVILQGDPFEMGYARGVLLKNEIRSWVRDVLYMVQKLSFGTSIGRDILMNRAKEIEKHIPKEYLEELLGLSAATDVDYTTLLMLNIIETIGRQFKGCTSLAVTTSDGSLLRSRNLDYQDIELFESWLLVFYKPTNGSSFVSVSTPASIGVLTAMNENGITIGTHEIYRSSKNWQGIPADILHRYVIQYSSSLKEAEKILSQANRTIPELWMVTDTNGALNFEFNQEEVAVETMTSKYLILTNHTRQINEGLSYPNTEDRYSYADSFLEQNMDDMNLEKLISLIRSHTICCSYSVSHNIHAAIFKPATLDFWIAIDTPIAARGKWIGFNLPFEIYEKGEDNELINITPMK